MKMKEVDEEVKDTIRAIQLRSYVNPHKVFNAGNMEKVPKYFQIGTVVAGPTDFKDQRLTKKQRKQDLAEELLEMDEQLGHSKKKFKEIQAEKE